MKYLENAISFARKHYMLAIPLLIATALSAMLGRSNSTAIGKVWQAVPKIGSGVELFRNPTAVFSLLTSVIITPGLGFLGLILTIAATASTYGVVNYALNGGFPTLNDFVPQFKNSISKYLIYWLGTITVWFVFCILVIIIGLIAALISLIANWLGVLFIFLMLIVIFFGGIYTAINITLWFPAMIVDELDVVTSLKKSFSVVRKGFWPILGISILISMVASLVNIIFGFIGFIPLIGPILLSIIPTASTFILIIFFLMYYRGEREF